MQPISYLFMTEWCKEPGPWFNIKMSSYQYRKSLCGDKTVVRSSYLHNGISYTGKTSLYWIRTLAEPCLNMMTMLLSSFYNGNSYTGKMVSLYWDQVITKHGNNQFHFKCSFFFLDFHILHVLFAQQEGLMSFPEAFLILLMRKGKLQLCKAGTIDFTLACVIKLS